MVRDEADVIGAMLQHHAAQGIDEFIITDNASIDGTTQIIEELANSLQITLFHDPVHRKQQGETVTRMARLAAERGATWVVNADADEFWVARNPSLSLRDAFSHFDPGWGSFAVPVYDMTGPVAHSGSGLQRLTYRDLRSVERMRAVGIQAHATPDAVHVADPDVVVSQGNHFVSIPSAGEPGPEWAIEVLHFPWRSWSQFSGKVERSGLAYERAPGLEPSANHHGMRDYRRLRDGVLLASYVARHPDEAELQAGLESGELVEDRRIADTVPSPVPDIPLEADQGEQRRLWEMTLPLDRRLITLENLSRTATDEARGLRAELDREREGTNRLRLDLQREEARAIRLEAELDGARLEISKLRARRVLRIADRLGRYLGIHPR